jgi:cholesterol transport system auxiliary component
MRAALIALLLVSAGCALTSKAAPVDIRYFAIDAGRTPPPRTQAREAPELVLGRVTSSAFLRNPIVVRRSDYEIDVHDNWRWTEYPEEYVRRSLAHTLFEGGRFVQGLSGNIPTLDVELIAFEEVVRGDAHAARIELAYRLHDERIVLATGVVKVERDATAGKGIDAVVAAVASALEEATTRVSDATQAWFTTAAVARAP